MQVTTGFESLNICLALLLTNSGVTPKFDFDESPIVFAFVPRVVLSSTFQVARDAICALILGAPPGKVYNQMRNVARRMSERF